MEEMPSQHHPVQYMQTHRLCIALWARSSSLFYYLDVKTGGSCSPWFRGAWVFQSWDINREEIWESSDECLLELWHMLGRQTGVTGHNRHQRESQIDKGARCFSFCFVSCYDFFFSFFFFLWAEPFVSAHINALHGLIISHTCQVCHLHSGTARNEKGRTI